MKERANKAAYSKYCHIHCTGRRLHDKMQETLMPINLNRRLSAASGYDCSIVCMSSSPARLNRQDLNREGVQVERSNFTYY